MEAVERTADGAYLTRRTFDPVVSLSLDAITIALESQPSAARRAWLRLRKFWLERHVDDWREGGAQ